MCVRQSGLVWLCSSDSNGLAHQIGSGTDPLNLIKAASKFKDDVLFSGLLFMSIALSLAAVVLLAKFPSWQEEMDNRTGEMVDVMPFPSKSVSQAALACSLASSLVLLMACLWQHIASVGAAAITDAAYFGNVKTDIGTTTMVLTWIGFGATIVATLGLLIAIVTLVALTAIEED